MQLSVVCRRTSGSIGNGIGARPDRDVISLTSWHSGAGYPCGRRSGFHPGRGAMRLDTAAVIVVCVLAVILWWSRRRGLDPCVAVLPPELRRARLVYAERLFRSVEAVSVTAKVDRVYRNAAGALVLVELKTRAANRAYWSDVIELSAQRMAVMGQTGEAVADHAYVLAERSDGRRIGWHRVRLMSRSDLITLAARRLDLRAGKIEPQPTCSPGMCAKCAFVRPCAPPWLRSDQRFTWSATAAKRKFRCN